METVKQADTHTKFLHKSTKIHITVFLINKTTRPVFREELYIYDMLIMMCSHKFIIFMYIQMVISVSTMSKYVERRESCHMGHSYKLENGLPNRVKYEQNR